MLLTVIALLSHSKTVCLGKLRHGAGDSVKVKWTQDGTAHELTVTPSATTPTKMTFEPVAAFDDIPEGTFLTFVFNLRGQTEEFQTMLVDA